LKDELLLKILAQFARVIPREGVESDYADVVRVREGENVIPREGVERSSLLALTVT